MIKKYLKALITFIFLVGLVGINSAWAAPIVPCGTAGNLCKLCHLWLLASNVINFIAFTLAIPIAILSFVAAGVLFLISGGNENRVALAKSIFTNTIIGIVIIFLAWLIVDTLIKSIAGSGGVIGAWNSFPACP